MYIYIYIHPKRAIILRTVYIVAYILAMCFGNWSASDFVTFRSPNPETYNRYKSIPEKLPRPSSVEPSW